MVGIARVSPGSPFFCVVLIAVDVDGFAECDEGCLECSGQPSLIGDGDRCQMLSLAPKKSVRGREGP